MNPTSLNNANGIETRALDESIRHGHDAMDRAERLLAAIWSDVTGYDAPSPAPAPMPAGLVSLADVLAGRAETMVRELERLHARLTAPNVKSLAQTTAGRGYVDTAGLIDRQMG